MGSRALESLPWPVNIVRLTPQQYLDFRDSCENILIQYYARICTPSEVPEKQDHGNIDIFVSRASSSIGSFTDADLANTLGAKYQLQKESITSFAVPLPASNVDFFQLDVHTSLPSRFEWESTFYTHADIWRILGICTIRHEFSLRVTGLYLRIAEIAESVRNESLLHLTTDPWDLMEFLGLDPNRFRYEFQTLDDLFVWATSSRFFDRRCFAKQMRTPDRWMTTRSMYSTFLTEWLPQHPEVGADSRLQGADVVEEALTKFNKKAAWTKKLEQFRSKRMGGSG
ncbi:MAG: hypothetical protein Q9182_004231 [Xanthomendoza sp. 2 TL-2023]